MESGLSRDCDFDRRVVLPGRILFVLLFTGIEGLLFIVVTCLGVAALIPTILRRGSKNLRGRRFERRCSPRWRRLVSFLGFTTFSSFGKLYQRQFGTVFG